MSKDYDECRELLRKGQMQLNENARLLGELTLKIADTNDAIRRRYAEEAREDPREWDERMRELDKRISAMVSAIDELKQRPKV